MVTEKLNYDDKAVLASIGTGKTDGIFQLESAGMKSFMKELRPQPGRCDRGNFSLPARADGFYSAVHQRERTIRSSLLTTARS